MTPETLRAIGWALYREHWRVPLSRELGVSLRTVQRWSAGSQPNPEAMQAALEGIVAQRIAELHRLLAESRATV